MFLTFQKLIGKDLVFLQLSSWVGTITYGISSLGETLLFIHSHIHSFIYSFIQSHSFSHTLSLKHPQIWRLCSSVPCASTTPFPRSSNVNPVTSSAPPVGPSSSVARRAGVRSATSAISPWRRSPPPSCSPANTPPADVR